MKNNKGITLTVLVITVLVILLLASVITVSAVKNYKIIKLKNMYADLQILTEKVSVYFLEKQNIPIKEQLTRPDFLANESDRNINDNDVYYELDISKLENLSLNNSKDVYIINEMSHEIYSVKGAELDGKQYHRLPVEDYKYQPKIYYNIVYELNGGELPETAPKQYCSGVETELQSPTKNGYGFAGWYLSSSFTSVSKVDKIGKDVTGEITLYAKWEIATYDIAYVLDGGKNSSANPSTYNFKSNITLEDPTKEAYIFEGWFLDENFTQPIEKISLATLNVCRDITLYAKWLEAIAKIDTTYYKTLQLAVNDTTDATDYIEITMLHNTTESVKVEQNQKASIDLNGCKITAASDVAITNEGYLKFKDTNTTGVNGTIQSTTGIAILNYGSIDIGVNDGIIQATAPSVDGYVNGIKSESKEGINTPLIFNFYDGIIAAKVAVVGNIDEVPEGYSAIATKKVEADREIVTLGILGQAVAEIDTYYFMTLNEALEYVEDLGSTDAKTINLLRDCTDNATIKQGLNVRINLNGSSLLTQNSKDYLITNQGNLEIVDLNEETTGKLQGGYLVKNESTGTLKITNLSVEPTFVGIYNEGTANLEGGQIKVSETTSTIAYGVQNLGTLNLNNETVIVDKTYDYGIYNEENGIVNNTNTNYSVSVRAFAIYNKGDFNFISGSAIREISYSVYDYSSEWWKLIHNEQGTLTLEQVMLTYKRIYDHTDSTATPNWNNSYEHNVIYNNKGTVVIKNDTIINIEKYVQSNGYSYTFDINAIKNIEGNIIIGENDNILNEMQPEINACIDNVNGTLEIYDGIINASGTIEGGVTKIADGYMLETSVQDELDKDGEKTGEIAEITKLVLQEPIASIGDVTYSTIKEAIEAVPENLDTETEITILKNVRLLKDDVIEIPSTKNVKLNVNGKILAVNTKIINNGILKIDNVNLADSGMILLASSVGIENKENSQLNISNIYVRNYKEGRWGYDKYDITEYNIALENNGILTTNNSSIVSKGRGRNCY